MKKYAVIDIGSNTVRMVVYAVEENDTFHALFSKKYTLGLAGYVQDGVMSQEGIHRLCGVVACEHVFGSVSTSKRIATTGQRVTNSSVLSACPHCLNWLLVQPFPLPIAPI